MTEGWQLKFKTADGWIDTYDNVTDVEILDVETKVKTTYKYNKPIDEEKDE